jgi:hypothetical protein
MGESAGESVSRTALTTTGVETPQRSSTLVEWLVQFDSPAHRPVHHFTDSPIHHFKARQIGAYCLQPLTALNSLPMFFNTVQLSIP